MAPGAAQPTLATPPPPNATSEQFEAYGQAGWKRYYAERGMQQQTQQQAPQQPSTQIVTAGKHGDIVGVLRHFADSGIAERGSAFKHAVAARYFDVADILLSKGVAVDDASVNNGYTSLTNEVRHFAHDGQSDDVGVRCLLARRACQHSKVKCKERLHDAFYFTSLCKDRNRLHATQNLLETDVAIVCSSAASAHPTAAPQQQQATASEAAQSPPVTPPPPNATSEQFEAIRIPLRELCENVSLGILLQL